MPWSGALPTPDGLTADPHQLGAARFALSRNRSYLASDPGTGKTIMAAVTMNAALDYDFFYLCPAFLVANVTAELEKWCVGRMVMKGLTPLRQIAGILGHPFVCVVPDSILTRPALHAFTNQLKETSEYSRQADLWLVVDECHRFSNPKSQRSGALFGTINPKTKHSSLGYRQFFKRETYMTGTPMPNRPMEQFPILSNVFPETIDFMTYYEFGKEYCDGKLVKIGWDSHKRAPKMAWDFKGESNLDTLVERTQIQWERYRTLGEYSISKKQKGILRIRKDVLDLPPIVDEVVMVGGLLPAKVGSLDKEMLAAFGGEDRMEREIAALLSKKDLHLSTYRKEIGKATARDALPMIKAILEDTDESLILGIVHPDVGEILAKGLAKWSPIVIDGTVDPADRVPLANEFQTNPMKRVAINSVTAGGIGLNMQKADRVLMVEFSWVPGENDQLPARAHRRGRKDSVLVQYLVYRESCARRVLEKVLLKRDAVRKV